MEMIIDFPGDARVDAHFGPYTVKTDQPPASSAPTPFALFLASLGTCAGIYVLGFCRQRGISSDGIKIVQRLKTHPITGMIHTVEPGIYIREENLGIRIENDVVIKKDGIHDLMANIPVEVEEIEDIMNQSGLH